MSATLMVPIGLLAWLLPGLLLAAAGVQLAQAVRRRSQAALGIGALALLETLMVHVYGPAPQAQLSFLLAVPALACATALLARGAGAGSGARRWIMAAALSHALSLPALALGIGLAPAASQPALPAALALLAWQLGLLLRASCYLAAVLAPARAPAPPSGSATAPVTPAAAGQPATTAPSAEAWQTILDAHRQASSLLAHELRAPLATLDTAAQALALAASEDDAHAHARLARMRRAVKRINELTEDFLGSGKLGERLLQPHREVVDLQALAGDLAARLQADTAHGLQVLPGAPVLALADPRLCTEVLRNLLHNAVKYSAADQPIVVSAGPGDEPGIVAVSVSDRGPGIAEHEREKIFDPYYRRPIHQGTQGTGVGLYLSREMCRRQGGDLRLVRSGPEGSVFSLRLQAANT